MSMNKADILSDCIRDEIDCLPLNTYNKIAEMVDELVDLAEPNAEELILYKNALEKVLEDSEIGIVPKSHLNYIEALLEG